MHRRRKRRKRKDVKICCKTFFCPSKIFPSISSLLPMCLSLPWNRITFFGKCHLPKLKITVIDVFIARFYSTNGRNRVREIKQLIEKVQNSLPNIEDIELGEDGQEYGKKINKLFLPIQVFL